MKNPLAHTVLSRRSYWLAGSALMLLLGAGSAWHYAPHLSSGTIPSELATEIETIELKGLKLPRFLSEADETIYQQIFALESKQQWKTSDTLASRLSNPLLLGHLLAERYLSPDYDSSSDELLAWLRHYPALPQADRIYELALNKNPGADLPKVDTSASLSGFGDDNGLHRQTGSESWRAGLNAWEFSQYPEAARQFTATYTSDATASDWTKSAAAYWASRAYRAAGDKASANKYLALAAEHPRTFYGIIALRQQGRSLVISSVMPTLDESTLRALVSKPSVQRAVALTQFGKTELADMELRQLFPDLPREQRPALVTLASALDLPSVQITMARQLAQEQNNPQSYDFALYPRPDWVPESGFKLNPALIYAFARQESGFRISAQSDSGAIGLMQLMPRTAVLVNKRARLLASHEFDHARIYEPVLNLSLGQSYLAQLMKIDRIGPNLLTLAAAYNAGPAKALRWQSGIDYSHDPLLFLERIPYPETRHYAMQVMTNYWVYSALDGHPTDSALALAQNRWPVYSTNRIQTAGGASGQDSDTRL